MIDKLHLNFSRRFEGIIWNLVASGEDRVLLIEVRDPTRKRVRFSAVNYDTGNFRWTDRELEEAWWVNASSIVAGMVLFTIYLDTNNPDKKGVLAYSLDNLDLVWWNNDFSVSEITSAGVKGFSGKFGISEVILGVADGKPVSGAGESIISENPVRKPVQYVEGMEYFETVKTFLAKQLNLEAVSALEYLETDQCFLISCYCRTEGNLLANFLFVFSKAGKLLLNERLDAGLSGIGLDTFFVIEDFLFFVKDKVELLSFRIL